MKMKIAQIQIQPSPDMNKNLQKLSEIMKKLDPGRPDLVALGEMFCCPYGISGYSEYAEPEGGEVWETLSSLAREHKVWLSAGTVPERGGMGRIYNTAYIFDRNGRQAAKHRKLHLYDAEPEEGKCYRESDSIAAGDGFTVFDTEFGTIGVCICYDIRFPELARMMVRQGAFLILCPAQFNRTTGKAHWELTFRARAVDNQCFYAGTSTAFREDAVYHSYGHSILVSPWGEVVDQMDDREGFIINEIETDAVYGIRKKLPLLSESEDKYQICFRFPKVYS